MSRYCSDKTDTRFGLELVDLSEIVANSDFKVFSGTVSDGGRVNAINVKGAAKSFSRKDIDHLTEYVKVYGAKGLAWVKIADQKFTGPIAKFFDESAQSSLMAKMRSEERSVGKEGKWR